MTRTLVILIYLLLVQNTSSVRLEVATRIVLKYGETMATQCKLVDINVDEYTAEDVAWYKNGHLLSEDMYSAVNTTTSLLSLSNVTFDAEGNYSCQLNHLDQVVAIATTDIVVGRSPSIANFSCVCYNMGEMWCTWDPVDNNLPTQYVFTWRLHYERQWRNCPDTQEKGPNSCYFDFYQNLGSLHRMRVTSTNELDSVTDDIWFNPDTDTVPYPPENISLIPKTATSLQVQWSPPSDWYSDYFFLQYKLQYYSEWEPGVWSQELSASAQKSYTITGLEPYTRYFVRVSAKPTAVDGHWSEWSTITIGRTLESAPTEGVKLYLSQEIPRDNNKRDVIISWTPPSPRNSNGVITSYHISVKQENHDNPMNDAMNVVVPANNDTEYTIIGLDKYISYYVSVMAINNAGTSPLSGIRIVDKTTAPGEPKIKDVKSISEDTIAISWEEPDRPNGAIKNYVLSYAASPLIGGEHQQWHRITVNSSVFYYEVSNLKSSVRYEFKIQAKNSVGFGGNSHTVTMYTKESEPNGPATNLTLHSIETNPHSLSASWIPPCLDDRNGIIRGYIIKYCPHVTNGNISGQKYPCKNETISQVNYTVLNPESLESSASTCHYDITNLRPNTEYAVWVLPFNNKGLGSEATNIVTTRTSEGPPEGVPVNLQVQIVTASKLAIMWEPPKEPNAVITYYDITVVPLNSSNCPTIDMQSTAYTVTFSDLCGFEMYKVMVKACSESKIPTGPCGNHSSPIYVRTEIGAPGIPRNVIAAAEDSSTIEIVWSPPERLNGPLTDMTYQVSCWNKINSEPVILIVESNETRIRADCDNINEGVPGICTVQAISAEGQAGAVVNVEPEPLVCYNPEVLPYILTPIGIVVFLVLLGVVIKLFCIYAKKKEIDYQVPKLDHTWKEMPAFQATEEFCEGGYDTVGNQTTQLDTNQNQENKDPDIISNQSDPGFDINQEKGLIVDLECNIKHAAIESDDETVPLTVSLPNSGSSGIEDEYAKMTGISDGTMCLKVVLPSQSSPVSKQQRKNEIDNAEMLPHMSNIQLLNVTAPNFSPHVTDFSVSDSENYVKTCLGDDSSQESTEKHGCGTNQDDGETSGMARFYDESDEDCCENELDNPVLQSILGTHEIDSLADAPWETDKPLSEPVADVLNVSFSNLPTVFGIHSDDEEQRDSDAIEKCPLVSSSVDGDYFPNSETFNMLQTSSV
uniref:Receptor-type tyrosine-protein phosphatase F-like n=1 Tax=Saccoglossus kowalevskii TaxID=10224 RepID=A0ABM0MKX6_SACKO|nr:PREDICTED: receptor-type tyrosine-protein phosphatase F-like [Saccoglossus kowalevskii]